MKVFRCTSCEAPVYFENVQCVRCGSLLAFLPDRLEMAALNPGGENLWTVVGKRFSRARRYRLCFNYRVHQVCNWAVPEKDPSDYCVSCRQSAIIPDLSVPGNLEAWARMESAKRRLVYSLILLGLPVANRLEDPVGGIVYHFLDDAPAGFAILTGHESGLITINLAEADDAERERRRLEMREPYRTLLGHFRHEVGHYYWDRLVSDTGRMDSFRRLFGDETLDYGQALARHHNEGVVPGWQNSHISSYATSHPWEDWAETWAHYLHMSDTLETTASCGLHLRPTRREEPSLRPFKPSISPRRYSFRKMIEDWPALTHALNNLNRGLGLPDGYPFVLSDPVVEKLRFIHESIIGGPP